MMTITIFLPNGGNGIGKSKSDDKVLSDKANLFVELEALIVWNCNSVCHLTPNQKMDSVPTACHIIFERWFWTSIFESNPSLRYWLWKLESDCIAMEPCCWQVWIKLHKENLRGKWIRCYLHTGLPLLIKRKMALSMELCEWNRGQICTLSL